MSFIKNDMWWFFDFVFVFELYLALSYGLAYFSRMVVLAGDTK